MIRNKNQWLCSDTTEVLIVISVKLPATVMVLGVIFNDSDTISLHIFAKGLKINTEEYLKFMEDLVKHRRDQVATGRHYVYQHDGTPAHNSKGAQE